MSIKAITWAIHAPVGHSPAKQLLTVMAYHEHDNMLVWASVTTLVQHTGQDRKTILSNLKRLVELGYLVDTGRRVGQTKSVVVWQLTTPESGPETDTTKPDEKAPKVVPETGSLSSPETGTTPAREAVPVDLGSSPSFEGKQSQKPPEAVPVSPTEPLEPKEQTLKTRIGGDFPQLTLVPRIAPTNSGKTEDDMTKGTRLPADWILTKALGNWALAEVPGWTPDDVRKCAEQFKDYWIAVPGKDGVKLDWDATWRNSVRRERKFFEQRNKPRANVHNLRSTPAQSAERRPNNEAGKRLLFGNSREVIDV